MYEKKRGKDSFWYPFIRELDRQRGRGQLAVESPLLWTLAELEYLQGSPTKVKHKHLSHWLGLDQRVKLYQYFGWVSHIVFWAFYVVCVFSADTRWFGWLGSCFCQVRRHPTRIQRIGHCLVHGWVTFSGQGSYTRHVLYFDQIRFLQSYCSDLVWGWCDLQQYPFDIPTEAFSFDIFKQAFVAVQSCVVHLQVWSLITWVTWA